MPESVGPIDHLFPLTLGGALDAEIDARATLLLPSVDMGRAITPRTPGFPPYPHFPLQPPEFHQLIIPQLAADVQDAVMVDWRSPLAPIDKTMGRALEQASTQKLVTAEEGELRGVQFDPLYAYLIYLAVCLGTITLPVTTRYTILWTVLLLAGLLLSMVDREAEPIRSTDILWGAGLGLVFSIPFLILNWTGLSITASMLYPFEQWETLFFALVIVAPLAENLFFRGAFQDERGFALSVVAVGISSILFFGPALYQHPVNFIVAVVVSTVFAAIYSFLKSSISMMAAIACQIILNLTIFMIPSLF